PSSLPDTLAQDVHHSIHYTRPQGVVSQAGCTQTHTHTRTHTHTHTHSHTLTHRSPSDPHHFPTPFHTPSPTTKNIYANSHSLPFSPLLPPLSLSPSPSLSLS